MKINVDRAVGRHGNRGVAATICLDHLGNYMGSSSITYLGINGVPTLEALACREALALAKDLDISRVLVSSNCAMVINDIETNQGGRHATIIQETRASKLDFLECDFMYERRSRNYKANSIAKFSLSLGVGRRVWFFNHMIL